ncbi:hypothetical protein QIT38_gp08 [Methanocaldococcus fervens tailed virus 1]|uniref:Uncharacterized protein n=2 Tax=root TaxID=1 RepID=C7P5H0_METFA|nr:hypothetical protein [Methanocaldococcus fervens]YP_010772303.1 hypothetical protein QIT38_gp08 [Methanocaldococcus fervens tailed virus 1]ACV25348.1 hypothetical protein Mefer_1545 [Methanocaldococcus fervens AG86]QNO11478.1 hypothetical protein [Methanocaldococcus fervens tailed virus 1]
MDKQTVIGFVALFLVLELVFYLKGLYQSMALTLVVFGIFSLLFFLYNGIKGNGGIISAISDVLKPPHQRVKKIVVGDSKASNNTIIRIEKETQKIHYNEDNRKHSRNDNSFKTSSSCVIPIVNDSN